MRQEQYTEGELKYVPISRMEDERREEVIARLERIEYGIEELKTLQVEG